jgi:hypothetical protein
MAKIPVVFKYGTRAQYDALATKDEHALYFLTDTGEIYRGAVNLARGSHFEGILTADDVDDMAVIARVLNGQPAVQDDIFVVKALIANGKYSYTSYVYDDGEWKAMDGNYSAKNVYFHQDLTATAPIGVVTIPETGSATITAAGKSLQDVLVSILAEELQPEKTLPDVSITTTNSSSYEVGEKVVPNYSATLSAGSYTYGPATGIVATDWTVNSKGTGVTVETLSTASGNFSEVTVTDGMEFKVSATANYDDGAMPVTNMGNDAEEDKQIVAGSDTTDKTLFVGYRNYFYGVLSTSTAEAPLTSAIIRGLTAGGKYSASKTINLEPGPKGAKRVVVAIPEAQITSTRKGLKEVLLTSSMNSDITENYGSPINVSVEGANGHTAINYKVWVYEPASLGSDEKHKITLA